mgnify:FL=1
MMKNKLYFISGLAIAALALLSGCSRDKDVYQPTKAEIMANAEARLGVSIDPSLDWSMISQGRACITVNGNYDETYTVKIYSNDPLRDNKGSVLKKGEVKSGDTFITDFDYPSASKWLVLGLTDKQGFTSYKPVQLEDGLLVATIGSMPEVAQGRGQRKSRTSASVPHLSNIPTSEYAKSFLEGAQEPTDQNVYINWTGDPNYVAHFKITSTYDKVIGVLGSEGEYARTMYVSGKWTIPQGQYQSMGGGSVIVVDNGGEIVIPEYSGITFMNEARLIVMPGGKISGQGELKVTNGNADGFESYNGGEISAKKFNNNYGKFYNYGKLFATEYAAGAGESNIYNHGLVHIVGAGNKYYTEAANARIFNACQWYCDNDMHVFIVENTQGSYFYVGNTLTMSDGNDGTGETSYVSLASGALMRMGKLYNNNCEWIGPTSGKAIVEIGQVEYLTWTGDDSIERGKIINNIAISVDDKTNYCQGRSTDNAYTVLTQVVANYPGVEFVEKNGAAIVVPGDNEFLAGTSGCTPGYGGVPSTVTEEPAVWTYAFEDTPEGDYDMNDVVIKVREVQNDDSTTDLEVTLCCVGASFDLTVCLGTQILFGELEVHKALGQPSGALVNTGIGEEVAHQTTRIARPSGFSFATADFWIDSPAVSGGVHVAKTGEDPHGVAIPGDWLWPRESVSIKDAYPNFVLFAADVTRTDDEAAKWYETTDTNPVADFVFHSQQ